MGKKRRKTKRRTKKGTKRKKSNWITVHGTSLPYYGSDGKIHLYTLEYGHISVNEKDFKDVTTAGGFFNQFYTWKIRRR